MASTEAHLSEWTPLCLVSLQCRVVHVRHLTAPHFPHTQNTLHPRLFSVPAPLPSPLSSSNSSSSTFSPARPIIHTHSTTNFFVLHPTLSSLVCFPYKLLPHLPPCAKPPTPHTDDSFLAKLQQVMNCDSCGAAPQPPHLTCNCNNPDCSPSQSASFPQPPFNNRRWFLRRSSPRKNDPTTSNSSCSDDCRKPEDAPQSPVQIDATEPHSSECESDEQVAPQSRADHQSPDNSDRVLPEDQSPVEIDDGDPDLDDADLDARSMEVSAPQSETASTISRAAFSVGDKADVQVHPPVLTASHPAEERRKSNHPSSRPGVRAQLRAAYVRELLLSSLSM